MKLGKKFLSIIILTTIIVPVSMNNVFAVPGQGALYATVPINQELWTIDPSNGNAILVGNTIDGAGLGHDLPSLAVHPTTGVMYAGAGGNDRNLYIVNPGSGFVTLVGPTNDGNLVGLDFSSDGTLFAAVKPQGQFGVGGTDLGIVNSITGNTVLVGPFGEQQINGIAFLGNTLYGVSYNDELYSINTSTGEATLVASVNPSIDLGAAQFACDDTLYVGEGNANDDFGTLDITSGDFTLIANTDLDETNGGFAFIQTCTSVVAGELLSIDAASLMLTGLQSVFVWILPVFVSITGIGTYYLHSKMTRR